MRKSNLKHRTRLLSDCSHSSTSESLMLITPELLDKLPALYTQEDEDDPMIHVVLESKDKMWRCFVAEASKQDDDIQLFGFFSSRKYGSNWAQLSVREIECDLQDAGMNEIDVIPATDPKRASKMKDGMPRRGASLLCYL